MPAKRSAMRKIKDVLRLKFEARLSHEKGVDVLLEAFALLAERGCRPSLVVAGDGPDRAALETRAATLRLPHTAFLGRLDTADALYPELDLDLLLAAVEN